MSAPSPSLDIVTVAIAAAAWAIGDEAAAIVGPYTVILLSALGGAAWSASAPTARANIAARARKRADLWSRMLADWPALVDFAERDAARIEALLREQERAR